MIIYLKLKFLLQYFFSFQSIGHFVCGADASGGNKIFRSATHKSLNIVLCGLRLWKITYGDQVFYIEDSLGPETEIPVGLMPSKESKPFLTTMLARFENEVEEAENMLHEIKVEDKVFS